MISVSSLAGVRAVAVEKAVVPSVGCPDGCLRSRRGSLGCRPRSWVSPIESLRSIVDGNDVANTACRCIVKLAVDELPPLPPNYNVEAGNDASRGDVSIAKILQVLCGASLWSNFVIWGEGGDQDFVGNMSLHSTSLDTGMFYVQYCFLQPSEFHIFLEQMSGSLPRRQAVRSCVSRCTGLMWIIF